MTPDDAHETVAQAGEDRFLTGTTAVVTGASSGIGRAAALALAARGACVVLAARRAGALRQLADEINAGGRGSAVAAVTDVASEDDVRRLAETVERQVTPLGVLVNSAGLGYASPIVSLDVARLDEVMRVNFRGAVLCTKHLLPGMLSRRAGAIVNIGSISSRRGWGGGTPYVASKFALRGFALCLWHEVHSANIRVINLYPGAVATEMSAMAGLSSAQIARAIPPVDIGELLVSLLRLPGHTDVVELDVWPTNLNG